MADALHLLGLVALHLWWIPAIGLALAAFERATR